MNNPFSPQNNPRAPFASTFSLANGAFFGGGLLVSSSFGLDGRNWSSDSMGFQAIETLGWS